MRRARSPDPNGNDSKDSWSRFLAFFAQEPTLATSKADRRNAIRPSKHTKSYCSHRLCTRETKAGTGHWESKFGIETSPKKLVLPIWWMVTSIGSTSVIFADNHFYGS